MNFQESSKIKGLFLLEPQVFADERGFFLETYNQKIFADHGLDVSFVQDNHSKSVFRGVLRGLHFQKPPFAQSKLVRVIQGEVYDVAVDLRTDSPTFGQWEGFTLTAENKNMLFIPQGFAHGFLTLTENVEFVYKCDNFYNKESESGIIWNDPTLNISWPTVGDIILSDKDKLLPLFQK